MPLASADVRASVHACKGEQGVRSAKSGVQKEKIRRLKSALRFFRHRLRTKVRSMTCFWLRRGLRVKTRSVNCLQLCHKLFKR